MKILVDCALKHDTVPGWLHSLLQGLNLGDGASVLVLAAAFGSLVFFVVNSGVDTTLSWAWTIAGQRMANSLAADLFRCLQRRSLILHNRTSVGDSLSRLSTDTWCVETLTSTLLISPARNVVSLVFLGIVGWRLNPQIALLSLMLAPLLGCSSVFFGRKLKQRAKRSREVQARLLSFVQQTLAAIPVVQAFAREDLNRRRFEDLAGEVTDWSQRGAVINSIYGMVNGLIATLGVAIVLYFGGQRVLSGDLSVGGLLVFLTYMRNLQGASEGLVNTYGTLKPVEASIDRVLEILDSPGSVVDRPGALAMPLRTSSRHVRIENVTFGYEPGRPVLHNVTVEARPGETVALVGDTGAGKTTLASLIPRFFDPWEGRVTIDGIDIRDAQLRSVREQVALVLQEPFILPLTIAENIAYGRPDASRQEIIAAATTARAHDFIDRLPHGYDTVVGECGATLSGGEKQRLSIARALLKDPPILILDEPTSALDAATEALLMEALERLMAGRTTLIIAHRLSTVRHADQIVVLEHGRVVERGTHDELIGSDGLYSRYCSMQFAGRGVIA
jgi:ATP-binding cassette subfamily B protein/subfamily B ATP-binding cassette protein MsbA